MGWVKGSDRNFEASQTERYSQTSSKAAVGNSSFQLAVGFRLEDCSPGAFLSKCQHGIDAGELHAAGARCASWGNSGPRGLGRSWNAARCA